ncbi:MAG: hypothetical protein IV100_10680, partial [Myxococcales bacterium]|nr:hypothetical protein [Myxococcales bacterium]
RQFSSFVLLVGKIASADMKHAIESLSHEAALRQGVSDRRLTTKQASTSVVGAPRRSLPVLALSKSPALLSELHSIIVAGLSIRKL